jgi:hypothetical protein
MESVTAGTSSWCMHLAQHLSAMALFDLLIFFGGVLALCLRRLPLLTAILVEVSKVLPVEPHLAAAWSLERRFRRRSQQGTGQLVRWMQRLEGCQEALLNLFAPKLPLVTANELPDVVTRGAKAAGCNPLVDERLLLLGEGDVHAGEVGTECHELTLAQDGSVWRLLPFKDAAGKRFLTPYARVVVVRAVRQHGSVEHGSPLRQRHRPKAKRPS